MPTTAAHGIPYEIESVLPGPCEDYVPNANRTIVNTRVDFLQSELWEQDMVGTVSFNPSFGGQPGSPTALHRTIPELCPFAPTGNFDPNIGGIGGQWCTRCEQRDSGGSMLDSEPSTNGPFLDPLTGWPLAQWQRFRVTFEGLPFSVLTDQAVALLPGANAPEMYRYVTRSCQRKFSEQQIPLGQLFIAGSAVGGARAAPLPPVAGQFIKVSSAIVKYVWVRVPVNCIPYTTLRAAENLINLGVWDTVNPLGYSWPDGTLRFAGFSDQNKYQDATGIWVCDLELDFEYRNVGVSIGDRFVPLGVPLGWNYYFLPLGGGGGHFVGVTFDGNPVNVLPGTANVLYPAIDFNTLFWPQAA